MAVNSKPTNIRPYTVDHITNQSFDQEYQVTVVEPLKYNPAGSVDRDVVDTLAVRVDEASATVTYVGDAAIGSATSGALWRVKKIDTSSGTVITWADGNSSFDNIWDNRASLSYS